MKLRALSLAVASALAIAAAQANSITTLFGTNNNGSPGGMVYYDLTVGSAPINITAFDTNTNSTSAFGFSVYYIAGTYVGNTGNAGAWTLGATGNGTGLGVDQPSHVTLNNSFTLNANTTYGIAITLDANTANYYTNGTGANQSYSNSDLSLSLGAASNTAFASSVFSPRVWNGTIYYNPVPEPASLTALGLGAAALIRRRRARK